MAATAATSPPPWAQVGGNCTASAHLHVGAGTPISDRCWHLQVDASALYFLMLLSCEKQSKMIRDG